MFILHEVCCLLLSRLEDKKIETYPIQAVSEATIDQVMRPIVALETACRRCIFNRKRSILEKDF